LGDRHIGSATDVVDPAGNARFELRAVGAYYLARRRSRGASRGSPRARSARRQRGPERFGAPAQGRQKSGLWPGQMWLKARATTSRIASESHTSKSGRSTRTTSSPASASNAHRQAADEPFGSSDQRLHSPSAVRLSPFAAYNPPHGSTSLHSSAS